MKLFIASDIHGSAYYCKLMLENFIEEKADRMLLLGDILYHGPRNDLPKDYCPKDVIKMLNEISTSIYCVRGNCDTEVDQMVLEFPILADYAVIAADSKVIYATHGHVFNKENLPPLHSGDILLQGHTHVPQCLESNECLFLNPGSVSIPKENSQHGYMTFDGKTFLWKDLDKNIVSDYTISD